MAFDTQPGMVLGTVGYMSPEQVRAQPADHRADIFSLGAVLYEMVAGRRAFGGETAVGLERNATGHWQSLGTLATVSLAGGRPREVAEGILEADFSSDGTELAVIRSPDAATRTLRVATQLEFLTGTVVLEEPDGWLSHARVSPDGTHVAFIGHPAGEDAGAIVVAGRDGTLTALSEGWVTAQGLARSPDGEEIWFTASRIGARRALHAVSLAGRERLLLRIPAVLTVDDDPIRWSDDDRFLFVRTPSDQATLERVDIINGERELWKQIQGPDGAARSALRGRSRESSPCPRESRTGSPA